MTPARSPVVLVFACASGVERGTHGIACSSAAINRSASVGKYQKISPGLKPPFAAIARVLVAANPCCLSVVNVASMMRCRPCSMNTV
jgi:hypothetical protein